MQKSFLFKVFGVESSDENEEDDYEDDDDELNYFTSETELMVDTIINNKKSNATKQNLYEQFMLQNKQSADSEDAYLFGFPLNFN